jgi:hypothetical protein
MPKRRHPIQIGDVAKERAKCKKQQCQRQCTIVGETKDSFNVKFADNGEECVRKKTALCRLNPKKEKTRSKQSPSKVAEVSASVFSVKGPSRSTPAAPVAIAMGAAPVVLAARVAPPVALAARVAPVVPTARTSPDLLATREAPAMLAAQAAPVATATRAAPAATVARASPAVPAARAASPAVPAAWIAPVVPAARTPRAVPAARTVNVADVSSLSTAAGVGSSRFGDVDGTDIFLSDNGTSRDAIRDTDTLLKSDGGNDGTEWDGDDDADCDGDGGDSPPLEKYQYDSGDDDSECYPHRCPRLARQAEDGAAGADRDGHHVAHGDAQEERAGRQGAQVGEAAPGAAEPHHVRRHREADDGAAPRGERRRVRGAVLLAADEGVLAGPGGEQPAGEGRAGAVLLAGAGRDARAEPAVGAGAANAAGAARGARAAGTPGAAHIAVADGDVAGGLPAAGAAATIKVVDAATTMFASSSSGRSTHRAAEMRVDVDDSDEGLDLDFSNENCVWMRRHGKQDLAFQALDFQRSMCSFCKVGKEDECNREGEAMEMILEQLRNTQVPSRQSRKLRKKVRFSDTWDHRVRADGERIFEKETDEMQSRQARTKDPVCVDKVTLDIAIKLNAGGACLATTPSKMKPKRRRNVERIALEAAQTAMYHKLPNMTREGQNRMLSSALNKDVRQVESKASKQGKSNVDELSMIEVKELKAVTLVNSMNILATLPIRNQIPFLASVTGSLTRKRAIETLGFSISRRSWNIAKKHNIHPGPHQQCPKIKHSRTRVSKDKLLTFLDLLGSSFLQNHAVGVSRHTYENEEEEQFDRVSATASTTEIGREYAKFVAKFIEIDGIELPDDDHRCTLVCRKSGLRCMLEKSHKEDETKIRCRFSPPSMLSPSSIEHVVDAVSSGSIKSLAGLDDEDVEKGYNNFKRLHVIAKKLCQCLNKTDSETKDLSKRIKEAQVFTETSFKEHVKVNGEHVCQCLNCGFTSEHGCITSREPVAEEGKKKAPGSFCKRPGCTNKAKTKKRGLCAKHDREYLKTQHTANRNQQDLPDDVVNKPSKVQKKPEPTPAPRGRSSDHVACHLRENKTHKPPCHDCEQSFQIFSDLSGHATDAQKLSGRSKEELQEYQNLEMEIEERRQNLIDLRSHIVRKKNEADYDRKQMQSLKSHECIVVSDYKMKLLAMYHRENMKLFYGKRGTACLGFMVMTNTGQNDNEIEVHFYLMFSDDTLQDANFVLSAKAALYETILPTLFPEDTEKIDVHFRTDGAGCFNCNILKAVIPMWFQWTRDNGYSTTPVDEVSHRVSVNGGGKTNLDGTFGRAGVVFRTVCDGGRNMTDAVGFAQAFEDSGGVRGTQAGVIIPVQDIVLGTNMKGLNNYYHVKKDKDNENFKGFTNSGFGEGETIFLETMKKSWTINPPPMPTYVVSWQSETAKSTENVKHSTETKVSRIKRNDDAKSDARENKRADALNEEQHKSGKDVLHRCAHVKPDGKLRCIHSFLTKRGLDKHVKSKEHTYESQNLVDSAVCVVASTGGIMAAGTHRNRLAEFDNATVREGRGLGGVKRNDWFCRGCYLKPARKPKTTFTRELKTDLLEIYLEGETSDGEKKGKSKFSREASLNKLREMRDGGPDNLRKYSRGTKAGPLPSLEQIKGIFAQYIEEKNKSGVPKMKQKLIDMQSKLNNSEFKAVPKTKE